MEFSLHWLRSIFIPPVVIFLVLVVGSISAGFGVANYTLTSHSKDDQLWFENQYVEAEFPRNWFGTPMEYINSTSGNVFSAIFIAPDVFLYMGFTIYDEKATQTFIQTYNLTDARSIINLLANETYYQILETNSNATLSFIENGTRSISSYEADYSIYRFVNGYTEDNVSKNISYLMISYFDNNRLVQMAYWGNEDEFSNSRQMFETFISQIKVKTL
jgi:hypothetical protein